MRNIEYDINLDDMGSEYYEEYFGGPDDWEFEAREIDDSDFGMPDRFDADKTPGLPDK